ncbi:MAG: hypothetical protein EBY16_04020, partial [Gammaproteobacteria bacterium]|nr:hypothetical protein [Gammaproteobacteria bacterium]
MRNFRQYGEKDGFNKDASVKIGGEKLQPLPKRAAIRCLKHSLRDVKNLTRGISMQHFSNLSGYISWERAQDEFILQPRSYSSLFKPDAAAVQIEEPQHGELGHKPETILIVVSDGFKGFGDFLFALKLSEQLKKKYADSGLAKPLIFIVSQPSGKDKIIALQGDIEFSVEVLTLEDLKVKVESKEIRVDTIIEGPVFKQNLIFQIDDIFAKVEKPIPLFMLPEYGFKGDAGMITDHREYLKIYCENITYMGTVCSGFNQEDAENGILLSEQLFHPQPSFEWLQQLDPAIQRALLVDVDYVANTELTLQYSHDENLGTTQTAAEHFLKVHIEFSKTSDKKQDVVMVGINEAAKRTALLAIKDDLRGYGFTHISFFNVKTQSLEVIYDAKTAGKTYRVIYAPGMSHMSMMACIALSGPLCGATGDQSLAEALSANKVVVYEPLSHKKRFIDDYDARMRTIARSYGNSDVEELLRLLREAAYFWDYEELGNKLRTSGIIEEFQRTNARLIKGSNLANAVFDCLGCEQPLEELYDGTFIKIITTIMTLMKIEDSPRPQVGKLVEMPKDFLFSEALARRILEGKELVTHPTILSSSKGIYHLNLDPIGIGGWGNVYAAKQYALVDGQVQVTEPLAIKDMKGNRMSQLWKECAVFEKAHPGEHFEVFEQDHRSYLAMPLYKG